MNPEEHRYTTYKIGDRLIFAPISEENKKRYKDCPYLEDSWVITSLIQVGDEEE